MKRVIKWTLVILAYLILLNLSYRVGYDSALNSMTKDQTMDNVLVTPPAVTEEEPEVVETVEEVEDTTVPIESPVVSETLVGSDFKLYHYAPTGNATASGRMPEAGLTVAVDPRYIKLGSWLRIEIPDGNGGYKVYKQKVRADDTGGGIKGHVIDIFVSSESEAIQCGVIRNAKVYIIEE